jgi:hypothetical protein
VGEIDKEDVTEADIVGVEEHKLSGGLWFWK